MCTDDWPPRYPLPSAISHRTLCKLHAATKKTFSSTKIYPSFKPWPQCPLPRAVLLEPSGGLTFLDSARLLQRCVQSLHWCRKCHRCGLLLPQHLGSRAPGALVKVGWVNEGLKA